jgi:dephospho-CoA kinase
MIRICLIGKIASGKTFVSKCFKHPIFNADKEVQKIYKNNKNCFKKLNKKFPENIKNFPIRKSQIKQILNNKNIKVLSKIVHPYVRQSLKKFLKKNIKKNYIVLDIPLLIENKLHKKKDILIFVKTSNKTIIKRLKNRSNYNKKFISILKSQQLNINKKAKLCNFTIVNNSNKNNVLEQIRNIKKKLND